MRFSLKFQTVLVILIMILSINQTSSVELSEQEFDDGLNYYVIDRYADGTEIIRGIKNTNDPTLLGKPTLDQVGSHPLSSDRVAMLGGDEIMVSMFFEDPIGNLEGDLSYSAIEYDPAVNLTQQLNGILGGSNIADGEGKPTGIVAMGDIDGNFRGDFLTAISNQDLNYDEIQLRFYEQWSTSGIEELIESSSDSFGGDQQGNHPSVYAFQGDDDYMSEFIVVGLDNGVYTAFVFDDLMNSVEPRQIQYGDEISLRGGNNYISTSVTNIITSAMPTTSIAPDNFRFLLVHPNDSSSTELISYGDPVIIKDTLGNVWTVNEGTGDLSLQVVGPTYSNAHYFFLENSINDFTLTGGIYANAFLSLKSGYGSYLDYNSGNTEVPATVGDVFKIALADNIPYNMQTSQDNLLAKLQPDGGNLNKYDPIDDRFETVSIATGNLDNDDADEIVMVGIENGGGLAAHVFDDASHGFVEIDIIYSGGEDNERQVPAIGDVDGDGIGEVVILTSGASEGSIYVYDDAIANFALLNNFISNDAAYAGQSSSIYTNDIDGDGNHEIFYLDENVELTVFEDNALGYAIIFDHFELKFQGAPSQNSPIVEAQLGELAFGDIDSDAETEIIVSYYNIQGSGYGVGVFDWTGTGVSEFAHGILADEASKFTLHIDVGDFGGDKFTLEYTGDVSQFQTAGEISVVAAAPPNQLGLSQNYPATGTTFGRSASSSVTEGNSVTSGYSYHWTADASPSFFDIVEIGGEFTQTITSEFTQTNTITETIVVTDEYTGGNTDDFVIYTATVFDTYNYTVLDAQNPNFVGETLRLNVPNEPSVFKQTIPFYNENNADGDIDIDNEVFSHIPGHVPSYPSETEIYQKSGIVLASEEKQVGQGGGNIATEINLETDSTEEFERSYSVENSASGTVNIFGIGPEGGYAWTDGTGSIYAVTVGESTVFRASVGDIQDEQEYLDYNYAFGMAVYQKEIQRLGRLQGFYVIDYWVDTPEGWGGDSVTQASQAQEVASGVDELANELPFIASPVLLSISIIAMFGAWRRRNE